MRGRDFNGSNLKVWHFSVPKYLKISNNLIIKYKFLKSHKLLSLSPHLPASKTNSQLNAPIQIAAIVTVIVVTTSLYRLIYLVSIQVSKAGVKNGGVYWYSAPIVRCPRSYTYSYSCTHTFTRKDSKHVWQLNQIAFKKQQWNRDKYNKPKKMCLLNAMMCKIWLHIYLLSVGITRRVVDRQ